MQFSCTHTGCSRSYLRKEHLTRHMKSHERAKEFTCRECGTKLSRMDTYRRHMASHGSSLPSARVAQACLPCRRAKMKCDGQQPTCSGCSAKSLPCAWPVLAKGQNQHTEPSASIIPENAPVSPESSSMEGPDDAECEYENDLYDLMLHGQNTMALVAPVAECPGKLAMYDRLIAFYLRTFHHHWPILHEESIRSRRVPQVLLKTVVTIGLYLIGNAEAKKMATDTLERFLHNSGNTLASYVTLGEAGQLFPEPKHLFEFQAILLQAIMIPRLAGEGLATGIMIDSMLSRVLMLAGVYDQNKIDTASNLAGGHNIDPTILRESYQRYAPCLDTPDKANVLPFILTLAD
ncbi:hypothetical protein BGZ61DRAFT_1934 [Ilyonectria robusta]|uniref:uncharacterized protein n=1 Tax=Ilyonectria robusta TaxID=1079257 RepID=UPI001E8E8C2C|nr:uncharacterized protein BGZ61DRAFT_1934 [Ilyonectria robusta]KAH8736740.1 hypothetical protein BGZ61DRAFT_1934 [Ilyonectria robusta]